jgi:hypothetical protein
VNGRIRDQETASWTLWRRISSCVREDEVLGVQVEEVVEVEGPCQRDEEALVVLRVN